jgi:hypothetical protein
MIEKQFYALCDADGAVMSAGIMEAGAEMSPPADLHIEIVSAEDHDAIQRCLGDTLSGLTTVIDPATGTLSFN